MDLKRIKVGLLGGGISGERRISFFSAAQVFQVFRKNNINAVFIDIFTSQKDIVKELIKPYNINLAFIALHGEFGEDGKLQKILEELGIPYTGSEPRASYLAMDKALSKKIFKREGIPTPNFIVYSGKENIADNIRYPLVVKPHFSGSSLGVSIVKQREDLKPALDLAFSYQEQLILEEYIEGRELTVGILGEVPLAVVEIIPKKGYFDFEAKYIEGASRFVAPAKLEKGTYRRVQEISLAAHKALGCRHFSRVDLRLGKDNKPYVLEVNSIPGLTSHSLLPLSAKVLGITFEELILRMIELALVSSSSSSQTQATIDLRRGDRYKEVLSQKYLNK